MYSAEKCIDISSWTAKAKSIPAVQDEPSRSELQAAFQSSLMLPASLDPGFHSVVQHLLDHPGSMVRPRVVFQVAIIYGLPHEVALNLGIALEYFHTASLVFDDLPCMDNALSRRGVPCAHVRFGQSGAILGALALINRAYALAWQAIAESKTHDQMFLDWTGYARIFFLLAMTAVWLLLAVSFLRGGQESRGTSRVALTARIAGLLVLAAVPFAIYAASDPNGYPAVNPASGGPTGASQLESSLSIVLILLMLPFGITRRRPTRASVIPIAWALLLVEGVLCSLLSRADVSHHQPAQYLSLASLLAWIPVMPAYYDSFAWHAETRRWRTAFLWWWSGLVITGWILFLPGVLDRLKFTDALVGHSLTAVAGFLSALLLFMMAQLLGEQDAWIVNRSWSFLAWNLGVLAYVVVMMVAGWLESADPAFTIVPAAARNILYVVRLFTGAAMLAASMDWFIAAFALPALAQTPRAELKGVKAA